MIDEIIKPLTITNDDIKDNMKGIINAFVEFYGEENRKDIETKFKNVLILRKYSSDTLDYIINGIYNELYRKMFDIDSRYILNYDFNKIYKAIEEKNPYDSELLFFIDPLITTSQFLDNYYSGEYDRLVLFFKKYKKVKELIKPYEEELENNRKKEAKIRKKYYEKLVVKYRKVLPPWILKDIKDGNISKINRKECDEFIHLFFGYDSINYENCFSPKSESLLNDDIVSDSIKTAIKNERVKIFELYKLNKDKKLTYEEFLEDENVRKILNNLIELSKEIEKTKNELSLLQTEEIIKSQINFKDNLSIIEEKGYIVPTIEHYMYTNNSSQYLINFITEDNKIVFSPIIMFDLFTQTNDRDSTIIHELNHLYECDIKIGFNKITVMTGWDTFVGNVKLNKDNTRKYELISEYINDEISKEIASILRMNNNCIYSNKKEGYYSSTYSYLDFLLKDFYKEFKDVIIESRKDNNMNILFNTVGRLNFEALNNLVISFHMTYGLNMDSHKIVEKCISDPTSEEASYIIELINMKDSIIENMKKRSMKRTRKYNRFR